MIAQGTSPAEAVEKIGMVVEGLTTAPVLRDLSRRLKIELPITEGVCAVLGGEPLHELVGNLMRRQQPSPASVSIGSEDVAAYPDPRGSAA